MNSSVRVSALLPAALAALLVAGPVSGAEAAKPPLVPFDFVDIFFELNATDDDAGVQVFLDADEWDRLRIFDPNGRKILDISAHGRLGELGLTELFFESGEPSPDEVFDLFPEGVYKFRANTLDGKLLAGKATLSHDFLEAPEFTPEDGAVTDPANTVIVWDAVAGAVAYEVIVENEDLGVAMTVRVPASVHSLHVPPEMLRPDTEYEAEVLAIAASGNKTITETGFVTEP